MVDDDAPGPDELVISRTVRAGATVIGVEGELDLVSSDTLRPVLDATVVTESFVVLDLTAVSFLDSTALSMLVATHKHAGTRSHVFSIVIGNDHRRLFTITGLEGYLRLHHTLEDALPDL
jgi:anti-sigma B factor antagonist